MDKFYVYVLLDPRSGILTPFYVGKGSGGRVNRHHKPSAYAASGSLNRLTKATMRKIVESGNEVISYVVRGSLSEDEAFRLEVSLISRFGRKIARSGILTNYDAGGKGGGAGRILSQTTKDKMAVFQTNRAKSGIINRHSDEHKAKMRYTNPGSEKRKRGIVVIDYDGIVVDYHDSLTELAHKLDMLIGNCRDLVVKDGSMPRGKYFYRYHDSTDITDDGLIDAKRLIARRADLSASKKVYQLGDGGNAIAVFENVKEAVSAVPQANASGIYKALKTNKKHNGYYWQHK